MELDADSKETPKKTGYTPVKNRESFIQRKIRLLNEHDQYQRTSLENLNVRPVLSQVQQEQIEMKEKKEQLEKAQQESLSPDPKVKRTPVKEVLMTDLMKKKENLRRPVKTVSKCIQKHFEAWHNVGLADVMHDSKNFNEERKKAGMAATNRLYSLHAEQIKKRYQKVNEKKQAEGDLNFSMDQDLNSSTFMKDAVKKRSKLEQEMYELKLKNAEDPPIEQASLKKIKTKDQH